MHSQNNQNNKNVNHSNQQYYQSNYGQFNPNPSHYPVENSFQQKSQSFHRKTKQEQPTGLSTNYTSSNSINSKIKLISRGNGINENEYNIIVSSCIKIQDSKAALPLSIKCIKAIKDQIGGEWLVFVCPEIEKNYDFYISYVKKEKSLCFKYSGNEYYISRIN